MYLTPLCAWDWGYMINLVLALENSFINEKKALQQTMHTYIIHKYNECYIGNVQDIITKIVKRKLKLYFNDKIDYLKQLIYLN